MNLILLCKVFLVSSFKQLAEVESRTLGSRPRPRNTKKSEAQAKDNLSEDRPSRGQGQECSRPKPRTKDTSASASKKKGLHKNFSGDLQKLKKKSSPKFFRRSSKKKRFPKNVSGAPQNFYNSKTSAVLEPRTSQFLRTRGFKAKDLTFEAKGFKMCSRGQGRSRVLYLVACQKGARSDCD